MAALWGLFGELKNLFKLRSEVNEDNTAFKFVSKLSVAICITATLLLALDSYVGTSIECLDQDESVPTAVNQFCWMHGTKYIEEWKWSGDEKMIHALQNGLKGAKYFANNPYCDLTKVRQKYSQSTSHLTTKFEILPNKL